MPVIVDGSPALLEGEIWRVARPSAAGWLGLTAVLAAAMVVLLAVRRRRDEPVLVALAVVSASATAESRASSSG